MSSSTAAGLQFPYAQLMQETKALRRMTDGLLIDDGPLRNLAQELEQLGAVSADRKYRLKLRAIRTQPTVDYEPGSKSGGQEIYALITGIWEVQPVGRRRPGRKIAFAGLASAVVELWPADCLNREEYKRSQRLGMWRIELGTHDSPGCYFHAQILGDRSDPPFPKRIPIPRLPSPFVTPMAAVEYVLGELFQDEWERKTTGARDHHRDWMAIQRSRWSNLLRWQEQEALNGASSSPWMNLKAAKPPNDLFEVK